MDRMDAGTLRIRVAAVRTSCPTIPELDRVMEELDRARSEEARLLEESCKQAEQFKALADALERRCSEHSKDCGCGGCAALRMAGRIP